MFYQVPYEAGQTLFDATVGEDPETAEIWWSLRKKYAADDKMILRHALMVYELLHNEIDRGSQVALRSGITDRRVDLPRLPRHRT